MVWGGGALSLGVRAVPKGPIDRANQVSSSSLPPSRYSSTPRFERHPPLPLPHLTPASLLGHRCSPSAPADGRARGGGSAGGNRVRGPPPTHRYRLPCPRRPACGQGRWVCCQGLQRAAAPRRAPPPPPSLHRRPELLTGARWPQVPAAGHRRLGASTSPSRGPRHALGSSRLVTLSTNLSPDFSRSHQPSPGRLPRCSGIVGGCWRGYTHPSYVGECPWA